MTAQPRKAWLAIAAVSLSLSACGNNDPGSNNKNNTMTDMGGMDMNNPTDMGGDMTTPTDMGMDMTDPVDMGDMSMMPTEQFQVETCADAVPAAPAGQLCGFTAGTSGATFVRGTVLGDGKVFENGGVLIDAQGQIACVGCDCGTQAADANVVACPDGVVSPGLINAHDHITYNAKNAPRDHGTERFDHRHDWRTGARGHNEIRSGSSDRSAAGILVTELRLIFGGGTSVAGSGGTNGMARNLDRSGEQRGEGMDGTLSVQYETFPLSDQSGTLAADGCDRYRFINDYDPSVIFLPHVAEGIDAEARNEYNCLAGGVGTDTITERTSMIHGIGLTAADIAEAGARGAKLVWSPRTNIDLYGQTADVLTYRRAGVTVALGTDWIHSGSMNMLREFKCVDHLNQNHYNKALTDYDIWMMATANSAEALGAKNKLGKLAPGFMGDIAIFNGATNKQHRAVIDASVKDVALVLRSGKALYGDAALVDGLIPAADVAKCAAVDICGNGRKVCVELETGVTYDEVKAATTYELFYCDAPPSEPSCVPARDGEYTGMATADDSDGDGIANAQDSCPDIFNPNRPLSSGGQPNFDSDTKGDACDVCPISGADDTCAMFDPNDRDSDGTPNATDNCPTKPNAGQEDADADGIGDVCDRCPNAANPGDTGCPALVYDIKQGNVAVGEKVLVKDMVVSAVGLDGFFAQLSSTSGDFNGLDHSGVFVYARDLDPKPAAGDVITFEATVGEYQNQVQLIDPVSISTQSSGMAPAPTVVAEADLLNAGAKGVVYEGLLVRVENVKIAAIDTNANMTYVKYKLESGLFVDDAMMDFPAHVAVDAPYTAIIGGLSFRFGENHLMPSLDAHYVQGAPGLVDFSVKSAFLAAGTTGPTISPVAVSLDRPAEQNTTVALTYSDAAVLTGPASVIIPQGQQEVVLMLQGVMASGTPQTVTASLDGKMFSTSVEVYNDAAARQIALLDPNTATVSIGNSTAFTVHIDYPAPAAGTQVTLALNPGTAASVPATVTVPAGATSATFMVSGTAAGTETLTASIGGSVETATITVTALSANCLIISEYVEGSSNNKAIEVYNCGSGTLDMSKYGLCLVQNDGPDCDRVSMLDGAMSKAMLPAGGTIVLCHGSSVAGILNVCDIQSSGTIAHNGDDRYLLFEDVNGDKAFTDADDTILDAFGERAVRATYAANETYSRCDYTPYDGQGAFPVARYTALGNDTFTGLNQPPTMGCP